MNLLRLCKRQQYILRQRLKGWLRSHGAPACADASAVAFERFKQRQARMCSPDLSRLTLPTQPGLVSVVLPVYNGERYLSEAIQSVLNQTYFQLELIAVDDGSTDATPAILERTACDPRVRIHRQPNQQLPRALSNGFRAARGEFLTWISADNRFKPMFLERMVDCLQRHPAVDMIYANQDIIGQDGRPLRGSEWFWPYQRPLGSEHIHWPAHVADLNTRGVNFIGAAFMYRYRAYFLLGDYSADRFGLEDYDYWMRMNALLTLRHADFDEPVYDYRLHSESLTARGDELDIEGNRQRLLSLDAKRRDALLEPMRWRLRATDAAGPQSLAGEIRNVLANTGQTVADDDAASDPPGPIPCVDLTIVSEPGIATSALVPATPALRVLIACTDQPLPDQMPQGWDLCVGWSARISPVPLPARRGWLVTTRLAPLLSAIEIRVRAESAAR